MFSRCCFCLFVCLASKKQKKNYWFLFDVKESFASLVKQIEFLLISNFKSPVLLKKANRALYLLRRNVSPKIKLSVKLGLYKSILLPLLLYGMNCVRLSRGSTRDLKSFQKRALNWVCYESNRSYLQQLRLLNVLPLPLFMQCNDILLMSKLLVEGEHNISIPTYNPESGMSTMFFKLNKCKKEKTRGECVYRTCRIINRMNEKIQFANLLGLKLRIVSLMWKFVDNRFSDSNPCKWQLCCD